MISEEQRKRIEASRRALRWWVIDARADLPQGITTKFIRQSRRENPPQPGRSV